MNNKPNHDVIQENIEATDAWELAINLLAEDKSFQEVIVAVLDSGVDANHEDLEGFYNTISVIQIDGSITSHGWKL